MGIAGAVALSIAVTFSLLAFLPPRILPISAAGGSNILAHARQPVYGFEYHGWVENEGFSARLMLLGNSYTGVPSAHPDRTFLDLRFVIAAPREDTLLRVLLNGEEVGWASLGTAGERQESFYIPRKCAFRGLNVVHLQLRREGGQLPDSEAPAVGLSVRRMGFR